jgi:hypothetical protein
MDLTPITWDKNGLIYGFPYIFNDKGQVDWRRMIKPEFLVVNTQLFEKEGRAIPATTEGLRDEEILILLNGIKDLARLRGYRAVRYTKLISPSSDYVAAVCEIDWRPNFETGNEPVTFSDVGDACPLNTNGFGRLYLGAMAANRAFVRCVRNFLGIVIVGKDELAPKDSTTEESGAAPHTGSPNAMLLELMEEKKVTFENIKNKLVEEKYEEAENFASIDDIPRVKIFEIIGRLKKKK